MTPSLNGIDHIHIYVTDRDAAVKWYDDVLGMTPVKAFLSWAKDGGPLTIEDPSRTIHLALFERERPAATSTVAFGASGEDFLNWKNYLESKGLALRINDHDMAYSMYFPDPDENLFEITSYDHDHIRATLTA